MDETARKKVWADYARTKQADIREKIILEYAPLVKVVAGRLSMYFCLLYPTEAGLGEESGDAGGQRASLKKNN